MSLILACAMALDAAFGEPDEVWDRVHHPAVLMGKAVGWADDKLNHGKGRIVTGAVTIAGLVALAATIGWGIAQIGWLAAWMPPMYPALPSKARPRISRTASSPLPSGS
jgi:adenosylcobinamide-phosphate synthase